MKKLLILSLLILFIAACSTSLTKTEQTKEFMGTFVTITVYHEDKQQAEKAIEQTYAEIERLDHLLSNYKNTSEVSILNENKKLDSASNELIYILSKSLKYGDISKGAFDITVQPILDLYTHTFKDLNRSPTDEEIKETKKSIGYENIYIRNRYVEFTKPNMKITLGGIATGYIVDRAIEILKENGIKHALINAGGDIMAIGNKGNEDWQIALQNPRNKKEYITMIKINNTAVCTSGDYERYFDEDKKFHHIIDPKTGYSATELISVTIIAPTALECDGLSTSVFVMGKEDGLELIESLDNVEGLIITNKREIIRSSGFSY